VGAPIPIAQPDLSGNELAYVTECVKTGWLTHAGRFEAAFEKAFSERFKTPCIATSSGTGALHLALLSLGIGHGDEVIVPNLTFGATAAVVLAVGATPVLVDVCEDTWGLDKANIPQALTALTAAIIPVHLYGEDAGDFRGFGIPVIEDSCEALGFVPHRGHMTCYSFYGNKIMTTGEGGMLCGDFGRAAEWRNGGFDSTYMPYLPGLNYRMTNLQAAIGLAQLERFDQLIEKRKINTAIYRTRLNGKGKWLFVMKTDNPYRIAQMLKSHGVETRPVFPPLSGSPAYRKYAKGKYEVSESAWKGLALPTDCSPDETNTICDLILDVSSNLR
jgi:perosamine synthetase